MIHDFEKSPGCFILASFKETDESFDHELGTERSKLIEVKRLTVIQYVDGIFEKDVTPILTDSEIKYFSEWAIEKYAAQREV